MNIQDNQEVLLHLTKQKDLLDKLKEGFNKDQIDEILKYLKNIDNN